MKTTSIQSFAKKKDFTLLKFRKAYPQPFDSRFVFRLSYFLPGQKPARNRPTPHALKIQRKRLAVLNQISDLTKAGHSQAVAAATAGVSLTTAWRLRRAFTVGGERALLPKVITGRPAKASPRISERARSKAESLALLKRSARAGWIAFAETRDCPPALAKFIQANQASLPAAMLRAVRVRRVNSKMFVGPTKIALWARQDDLKGITLTPACAKARGAASGRQGEQYSDSRGKTFTPPLGRVKGASGISVPIKSKPKRLPI